MLGQLCVLIAVGTSFLGLQESLDLKIADPGLLQNVSVRKELKVTDEQMSTIDRIRRDYEAKADPAKNDDSKDDRVAENKQLSPDQLRRLREITLQYYGPMAMMADDVARRVGLTVAEQIKVGKLFEAAVDAQMARLKEVSEKESEAIDKMAEKDPEGAKQRVIALQQKMNKMAEELTEERLLHSADKQILDSLTKTRRQAWRDLQGKPFPVETLKKKAG